MSDEELQAIRERCDAATPPPWEAQAEPDRWANWLVFGDFLEERNLTEPCRPETARWMARHRRCPREAKGWPDASERLWVWYDREWNWGWGEVTTPRNCTLPLDLARRVNSPVVYWSPPRCLSEAVNRLDRALADLDWPEYPELQEVADPLPRMEWGSYPDHTEEVARIGNLLGKGRSP